MDTETAISTLQTESENLGANIGVQSNLKNAIDIALGVLNGTLQTQLTDLTAAQPTIAEQAATIAAAQADTNQQAAPAQQDETPPTS
jgi:septal ring factor EnvC (AmiA/AmiB activator)